MADHHFVSAFGRRSDDPRPSVAAAADFKASLSDPWSPLEEGQSIPDSAYVRTGGASSLELLKTGQSHLVIGERTLVALKLDAGLKDRLLVQTGTVLTQFIQPAGALQIRTPTANFGVRGTRFATQVNPRQGSRMAVEEGQVYALGKTDVAADAPGVLVAANQKVSAAAGPPMLSEVSEADQKTFDFTTLEQMGSGQATTFESFQKREDQFLQDFIQDDQADFQLFKLEQADQWWDFQLANNPARAQQLFSAPLQGK